MSQTCVVHKKACTVGTAVPTTSALCPVKPTMPTAAASPSALQGRRVLLSANSGNPSHSQPQHSPCCGPQFPSQTQGAASGSPSPCKQKCQASSIIPSLPCSSVCIAHLHIRNGANMQRTYRQAFSSARPHLVHWFSSSQLAAFHIPQ